MDKATEAQMWAEKARKRAKITTILAVTSCAFAIAAIIVSLLTH